MTIIELFEFLANTTWCGINLSAKNKVSLGEDAITSINLNAIASYSSRNVHIVDTRVKESIKGCDFELWVGNDSSGWRRYAIQAKKLNHKTERYDSLGHRVAGELQIDILERYATSNNAIPLYCFYNYSSTPITPTCCDSLRPSQFGCSIAPSNLVRKILMTRGGRTFLNIHRASEVWPWRCLVACSLSKKSDPCLATSIIQQAHLYKQLPAVLRKVVKNNPADIFNVFLGDIDGLFNSEANLKPRRIVVVTTGSA